MMGTTGGRQPFPATLIGVKTIVHLLARHMHCAAPGSVPSHTAAPQVRILYSEAGTLALLLKLQRNRLCSNDSCRRIALI